MKTRTRQGSKKEKPKRKVGGSDSRIATKQRTGIQKKVAKTKRGKTSIPNNCSSGSEESYKETVLRKKKGKRKRRRIAQSSEEDESDAFSVYSSSGGEDPGTKKQGVVPMDRVLVDDHGIPYLDDEMVLRRKPRAPSPPPNQDQKQWWLKHSGLDKINSTDPYADLPPTRVRKATRPYLPEHNETKRRRRTAEENDRLKATLAERRKAMYNQTMEVWYNAGEEK